MDGTAETSRHLKPKEVRRGESGSIGREYHGLPRLHLLSVIRSPWSKMTWADFPPKSNTLASLCGEQTRKGQKWEKKERRQLDGC